VVGQRLGLPDGGPNSEKALLHDGTRGRHHGVTNHKELFRERKESSFGVNDFFPFKRAELKESEPDISELLQHVWEMPPAKKGKEDAPPREVPPKQTFKIDRHPAFVTGWYIRPGSPGVPSTPRHPPPAARRK
jgi:hypothetical protein